MIAADQLWTQTADRNVWRACRRGLVLTVTRTGLDQWVATVEGRGGSGRSPVLRTRLRAQKWADDLAGEVNHGEFRVSTGQAGGRRHKPLRRRS